MNIFNLVKELEQNCQVNDHVPDILVAETALGVDPKLKHTNALGEQESDNQMSCFHLRISDLG